MIFEIVRSKIIGLSAMTRWLRDNRLVLAFTEFDNEWACLMFVGSVDNNTFWFTYFETTHVGCMTIGDGIWY